MSSEFDPADFVDSDFRASQKQSITGTAPALASAPSTARPLTREENDAKVSEMRLKIAELKQQQEHLERERNALEETRRKQIEFTTGRDEMIENLTRGVGLLEEAAFNARRDAEQMTKSLQDLQEALNKVQVLNEQGWPRENYNVELTRALTTIENARMEWNTARLKFQVLNKKGSTPEASPSGPGELVGGPSLQGLSFAQLCRIGFALTWPVALSVLLVSILFLLRAK